MADITITGILSILTIAGQIFILYSLFLLLTKKDIPNIIKRNSLIFAFVIALIASLGSLFYSEILKFAPCDLCWYQRAFVYPLVFLLGTAWLRKFKNVFYYIVPLTVVGSLISIYHYVIQMTSLSEFCKISNGVSCVTEYFTTFGYINMQMMALTAFILISILTYIYKLHEHVEA